MRSTFHVAAFERMFSFATFVTSNAILRLMTLLYGQNELVFLSYSVHLAHIGRLSIQISPRYSKYINQLDRSIQSAVGSFIIFRAMCPTDVNSETWVNPRFSRSLVIRSIPNLWHMTWIRNTETPHVARSCMYQHAIMNGGPRVLCLCHPATIICHCRKGFKIFGFDPSFHTELQQITSFP